jgi:hypothetical protein
MKRRSSAKRSRHHLKHLLEAIIAEDFKLAARGLAFFVDEIEVFGSPPEQLKVWATLHFLPLGSPFCCCEPLCHVPFFGAHRDRVNDAVRRQMELQQDVLIKFVGIQVAPVRRVEFDDAFIRWRTTTDPNEIDQRDALGRTALMRAAIRGYDRQVEELLKAGADPSIIDKQQRGILEQVPRGRIWIASLLENALGRSVPPP